ncbi:hypothetical protein ACIQ2D_20635 [Lysinibacillus sp. NPDC097287]|uniref:hypothetical protein n=1 Tax=Lysinibacillus sp. NPDC097287 TaxID=3364144 RepID=UPI003828B3F1
MRSDLDHRGRHGHRYENHRGGRRRGENVEKRNGAKTFRRGRALAFYEMMNTKSITLKKHLETPELQSINPILVGELKAIEALMDEFANLFELFEVEGTEEEIISNEESNETETN